MGLILSCGATGWAAEDDEGFTEDANAAIERALKEDKELILLFTGSDWCPPCKKLDAEVFSEKEFLFEVSKHYVLVKFDFPKQTEQDPEIAKQNEEYAKKFGIDSFPTLVSDGQHAETICVCRLRSKAVFKTIWHCSKKPESCESNGTKI